MLIENPEIVNWLLEGDPAIRWQTLRDLTDSDADTVKKERQKVATMGWGARFLELQNADGRWDGGGGNGLYSYKWTSTTYTMLTLRQLGLDRGTPQAYKACKLLLDGGYYIDGGINFFKSLKHSETCVTGMILSILSHFGYEDEKIHNLANYLLEQQMADGGWNCQSFEGATHSSIHTTINVLEGLWEFEKNFPNRSDITQSQNLGREFLLNHKMFQSHRSGKVIDPKIKLFSFPPRWRYDILRGMDYFQECHANYDPRLMDAMDIISSKNSREGKWLLQNRHPGRTYFEMERVGESSRWNTLRALRVIKWVENQK